MQKASYKEFVVKNKAVLYLALMAFVLMFGNQWVSYWDQDEAAYAGFAKGMVESGNWLMPDFIWSDVHRKPPLHFWNIAISYKIFGINEFATRLPAALSILLTLAVTYFMGRRLFGEKESFLGMVVLSTSFLVVALAKVSVTDATLLFFTTLCAFSMLYVLVYKEMKWVFLFWASFALALLVKGPPVILFSGVFAAILFLFHPQRTNLFRLHPWFFLPLAALPLYFWGYLCYQSQEGKEFITWMVDWYILKRVGGSVFGQTGPPGTHLLGIMLFFLPYFMFFPAAVINSVKNLFGKVKDSNFLLGVWFIAGWFIFELTPSKLPAYVVAAHVPMALTIGTLLVRRPLASNNGLSWAHLILNSIIFVALLTAPFVLDLPWLTKIVFGISGLGFIMLFVYNFARRNKEGFVRRLLVGNVTFIGVLSLVLLPVADKLKNSSLRIAQHIESVAPENSRIIIANNYSNPPSLPFYLLQRFQHVEEEYDASVLLKEYESAGENVFILTRDLKDVFLKHHPELQFVEFKPFFTDRVPQESYFILASKR
ncbi:glycosyltransferase family 39 protein [Cytophagaceae bacterium ABcell3]|nr:glycosyltransferase family 39 protein [Cytophagaceae bacterium ABcell3]